MARLKPALLGLAFLTSACVHQAPVHTANFRLTPEQAVMNAAAVAPQGVAAVFEMPVRATGRETGRLFLNSERDYRDQRCLTIVISADVERQLAERFGGDVETRLMGTVIAVRGMARRVRIDFVDPNGQPTGKYYYRTSLQLRSADDLTVAGEPPRV